MLKLIVMQENLGLRHKGKIILVTQKCLNNNTKAIADDILNAEWATFIVKACNSHADLLKACNRMVKILSHKSMRPMLNPAEAAELREAEIVVAKAK